MFTMDTKPPTTVELRAGDTQPIPPSVADSLRLQGPVRLQIDFLVLAQQTPARQ